MTAQEALEIQQAREETFSKCLHQIATGEQWFVSSPGPKFVVIVTKAKALRSDDKTT